MYNKARGIRNNNPFNIIKTSINWFGEVKALLFPDTKFEQFSNLELGIRAGLLNLRNSYKLKGFKTPNTIINRYAPLSDNGSMAQANYKRAISKEVFGSPELFNSVFYTNDDWLICAYAMAQYENGANSIVSILKIKSVNNDYQIFI